LKQAASDVARIVALTNGSPQSWIVLNGITAAYGPITVLQEEAEPKRQLVRRRMKSQGLLPVVGQVGFVVLQKLLQPFRQKRIAEILEVTGSNPAPDAACNITHVTSLNAMESLALLQSLQPDVIVVYGTRILGPALLSAIKVPIINFHSGLNPKYRGQAGGYWALAMGDAAHAGVTVHLVDRGVDTGDVLYHGIFSATEQDSFPTYFYLQAAALRPLAVKAVADALAQSLKPFRPDLPSQLFFMPTLWSYLVTGLTKGVW
jgi:folate-dependent phosphoribosylglycinamide formyltransferase PurN